MLCGCEVPEGWNETVVVLIPKVPNPEKLKDLRPISLCNVIYKIASKVLSNILKLILFEIISPNQSAFVPGRLITDNVLIAYELTHFVQQKKTSLDYFAALKLDMSKAYDRVEWVISEKNDEQVGFPFRLGRIGDEAGLYGHIQSEGKWGAHGSDQATVGFTSRRSSLTLSLPDLC
jgi:hypothetical protein